MMQMPTMIEGLSEEESAEFTALVQVWNDTV